ncbi:hypothetical protein CYLTODRAFT_361730, partial [Cylindrobasidium torrendii FP15055 ss-10]
SADCTAGSTRSGAMRTYYAATQKVAAYLKELFRVAYPAEHARYEAAFQAGQWFAEDPGPWVGRALVFKLQVSVHRDGKDDGPAAIFCAGTFSGGEAIFPDLGVKLRQVLIDARDPGLTLNRYGTGDVIIFMAGALYHKVARWVPVGNRENGMAPGRVGHVFFFPRDSFRILQDKPPDWCKKTNGGIRSSEGFPGLDLSPAMRKKLEKMGMAKGF